MALWGTTPGSKPKSPFLSGCGSTAHLLSSHPFLLLLVSVFLSPVTPILHLPAPGSPLPHPSPHQRDREAVPRLPRRPAEGQGEPILILCRQPARQRPVGGAQSWVPPKTARPTLSLLGSSTPGSASPQTPGASPREGLGASASEQGDAEEVPVKCGVCGLLPSPKARGSSALGKGAAMGNSGPFKDGGVRGVPREQILVGRWSGKVRQWQFCGQCPSGKPLAGWAGGRGS